MSWKRIAIVAGIAAAIVVVRWADGCAAHASRSRTGCSTAMSRYMVGRPPGPVAEKGELSVLLCGTASPIQPMDRAGACTMINAGGHFISSISVWHRCAI